MIVLLVVFLTLAKSYKKVGVSAPKGLMGFIEPLIVFIEEDVAIPNIGERQIRTLYALPAYGILFHPDQ